MLKSRKSTAALLLCPLVPILDSTVAAAQSDTDLAKASQNPVSDLVSVPFETNYNGDYGPQNGDQFILNIKPVIPVKLGEHWNLINRVIVPVVSQPGVPDGDPNRETGLGDTVYQAFLSPAKPGDIIWGLGPQLQLPTHTDEVLGNEHWAAGPSAVVLAMPGHWVLGGLFSHAWDFTRSGNDGSTAGISLTTIQPFLNYNFEGGWYLSSAPVITGNWKVESNSDWTVPVGGGVGRVFRIGSQPVNLKLAYYYNVEKPSQASEWDLQLTLILMFPK